jgi:hypothetical protein
VPDEFAAIANHISEVHVTETELLPVTHMYASISFDERCRLAALDPKGR